MRKRFAFLTLVVSLSGLPTIAKSADIDWKMVDTALGKSAAVSGEIHRYGLPRSDLQVTLDGVVIKPALALGGWVAFAPMHGEAMVMGDLVLLDTEITPVMTKLLEGGLEITAIHNHVLRASPATFYMHVGGHGDPVKMATVIRTALAASKTPFDPPATTAGPAPAVDLDTAKLDQIIGVKGTAVGGVYQFGVPRVDPATESGTKVSGPLGGANAVNFQPTGNGKAAITGDFLVTGNEVNPLIRALRAGDIEVTAIHSHMLDEQPRMFFIHFWANDDAVKLARNIRTALDKTDAVKGQANLFFGQHLVEEIMLTTRLIVLCAALILAVSSASAQQMRGSIEHVDEPHGSITVHRAPEGTVGASGFGSETFAVQDGLLFNALHEGDKVVFTVREINGVNTITKLQKE